MPEAVTTVSHNVKEDINASAGSLGRVKVAEVGSKTEVIADNLFSKYPNVDKLLTLQTMAATYCALLVSSDLKDIDKVDRWNAFQEKVLNLQSSMPPPRPPAGPQPDQPKASAKTDDHRITKRPVPRGNGDRVAASESKEAYWRLGPGRFPPNSLTFEAYGYSVPLVLVIGNNTDLPDASFDPYYISTAYVPQQFLREFARSHSTVGKIQTVEDAAPICSIWRADSQRLAEYLGFEVPDYERWINAYAGKLLDPNGRKELVRLPEKSESLDDAGLSLAYVSVGEGRANTNLSRNVSVHLVEDVNDRATDLRLQPQGCLRIMITVKRLRELAKRD
jgi:hypothetical protein